MDPEWIVQCSLFSKLFSHLTDFYEFWCAVGVKALRGSDFAHVSQDANLGSRQIVQEQKMTRGRGAGIYFDMYGGAERCDEVDELGLRVGTECRYSSDTTSWIPTLLRLRPCRRMDTADLWQDT